MTSKNLLKNVTPTLSQFDIEDIFNSPFSFLLDKSLPKDYYSHDFNNEGQIRKYINESKKTNKDGIVPINEMTRKEILSGADSLRKMRAKKIEYTHYLGVTNSRGWIKFETASQYHKGKKYIQYIKLKEAGDMKKFKEFDRREVIKLFLTGDLQVWCSCPDFRYRHKYKSWKMGYGLFRELRYPHIRNPYLEWTVCKHLIVVLTYILGNQNAIARDMNKSNFFKKKIEDIDYMNSISKNTKLKMSNRGRKTK